MLALRPNCENCDCDLPPESADARIVIDNAQQAHGGRTHNYNHLAILPYPAQHEQVWPMRGAWRRWPASWRTTSTRRRR